MVVQLALVILDPAILVDWSPSCSDAVFESSMLSVAFKSSISIKSSKLNESKRKVDRRLCRGENPNRWS
jgi:hypothetical protein